MAAKMDGAYVDDGGLNIYDNDCFDGPFNSTYVDTCEGQVCLFTKGSTSSGGQTIGKCKNIRYIKIFYDRQTWPVFEPVIFNLLNT